MNYLITRLLIIYDTGDSGGGLAQKLDERSQWILTGVVSTSLDPTCGEARHIIYTDVSKYVNWILHYININA